MKQTLNLGQQLSIILSCCYSSRRATNYVGDQQFAHRWFEPQCPTASSSHCLAALPGKMSGFKSYIQQNACHRNLKGILEGLFCIWMYPPNPLLIIVTTQASKQENTPEWKAETTLINICSIKWTLEVFSNHEFVSGARPIEGMRETTIYTTVK